MTSQNVGIEDARKRLGDLVTAVQQGADVILTRNGKPAARIVRFQEDAMITVAELAAAVGMSSAPEKVARFAGAFTEHDPRTGRLPKRWYGQGMDATFTRDEADQIIADWDQAAGAVEAGLIEPVVEAGAGLDLAAANRRHEAAVAEVQERYRP
jgi:prevent-host-death family protein